MLPALLGQEISRRASPQNYRVLAAATRRQSTAIAHHPKLQPDTVTQRGKLHGAIQGASNCVTRGMSGWIWVSVVGLTDGPAGVSGSRLLAWADVAHGDQDGIACEADVGLAGVVNEEHDRLV